MKLSNFRKIISLEYLNFWVWSSYDRNVSGTQSQFILPILSFSILHPFSEVQNLNNPIGTSTLPCSNIQEHRSTTREVLDLSNCLILCRAFWLASKCEQCIKIKAPNIFDPLVWNLSVTWSIESLPWCLREFTGYSGGCSRLDVYFWSAELKLLQLKGFADSFEGKKETFSIVFEGWSHSLLTVIRNVSTDIAAQTIATDILSKSWPQVKPTKFGFISLIEWGLYSWVFSKRILQLAVQIPAVCFIYQKPVEGTAF